MQSDVWGSISDQGVVTHITGGNFAQSSITINGWLRDFLWAQASQVIQSYGSLLSAYGLLFLAWQGNFEAWVQDPLHVRPIAHAIWDPHFGQPAVEAFTRGGAPGPVNISGVYQWCGLATPTTDIEIERFVVQKRRISSQSSFVRTIRRQWNLYSQNPNSSSHLFGTSQGSGTAILTLLGGFHPQTQSLWLTDIAHHHLAIAFLFLVAGHMYRTNFGIGHSIKDLLEAHIPPGG
ncbi:hypothetical protein V6N12_012726 [Hibiscus sabdariffa]|uniref:Photosystem I P700 apoprotein A2 n=1 Tax=Hibiscus sabdariffa TaxID=183260 RepID=A0ABR2DDE1_9ROSI